MIYQTLNHKIGKPLESLIKTCDFIEESDEKNMSFESLIKDVKYLKLQCKQLQLSLGNMTD